MMKMFWFNKIKSSEYLELLERVERIRIQMEALKTDFELTRAKLKANKRIGSTESEDNTTNSVLLPDTKR